MMSLTLSGVLHARTVPETSPDSTSYDPYTPDKTVLHYGNDSIYEVREKNGEIIFIGNSGYPVYIYVDFIPARLFTNGTVEVGSRIWGEITTLVAGTTATISETPIIVGTSAAKIGDDFLPMNLAAVSSVSSVQNASSSTTQMIANTRLPGVSTPTSTTSRQTTSVASISNHGASKTGDVNIASTSVSIKSNALLNVRQATPARLGIVILLASLQMYI